MSEEQFSANNVGEFAETQEQVVNQEHTQEQQGANESELANQKPVQDAETNAFYAEQRRKQELEQYRSEATKYQQELDRAARLSGYSSHAELVKAMDDLEKQQELEQYQQAGIDPDTFNKLLDSHPDIQYAREMKQKQEEERKFQEQVNELFSEFKDLKPEDIQPEVFQLQATKGLSLLDAYLRVNYKSLGQQAEQQAIQKLTTNQATSPGSLSGSDVNHTTSVKSMSSKDFSSLVEQVLRGERKQL